MPLNLGEKLYTRFFWSRTFHPWNFPPDLYPWENANKVA